MARILVKAFDAVNADPEINKRGCYKQSDVVVVMPDGHVWSPLEGLPKFLQLDLPGVPVEQISHLRNSEQEQPNDFTSPALRRIKRLFMQVSKKRERQVTRRRQYALDLSAVTFTDGYASVAALSEINKRGS